MRSWSVVWGICAVSSMSPTMTMSGVALGFDAGASNPPDSSMKQICMPPQMQLWPPGGSHRMWRSAFGLTATASVPRPRGVSPTSSGSGDTLAGSDKVPGSSARRRALAPEGLTPGPRCRTQGGGAASTSDVALEFGFRHLEVLGHDSKLGLPEFNSGVVREHLGIRSSTQPVVRALALNLLLSQLCERAENSFSLRHG